jgi:hypothetical protein
VKSLELCGEDVGVNEFGELQCQLCGNIPYWPSTPLSNAVQVIHPLVEMCSAKLLHQLAFFYANTVICILNLVDLFIMISAVTTKTKGWLGESRAHRLSPIN